MALPNALNRDPFLTGGVMDAPDPVVRSAMAKVMNPQGLPPMTQKELNRLLGRQYLEAQDQKTQANNASLQTMRVRQAISSGDMPPVDVRQYAGSMYAAPGSYTAARTLPAARASSIERSADELLKSRFGQMVPGQIAVAPANLPAVQAQPAPQAGYGYIQGRDDYLGTTPSGMVRSAEPVLGDQFQQLSGAMQPSQQAGVPKSPWDALPPVQPALMQPTAVAQPAPTQTPTAPQPSTQQAPPPASLGRALDQLIGTRPMSAPSAVTQQAPTEVTPSNIFSFSPVALNLANEQRELSRRQAEELRKRNLASAASSFALNQQLPPGLNLTESEINQAFIEGMGMREKGIVRTREDRTVDGKVVPYEVTRNLLTGEKSESRIRSAFPDPDEEAARKSREGFINLGIKQIEALGEETKLARTKADLAGQIVYAIQQGATTGAGAEIASRIKSFVSFLSPSDQKDYGAAIQKLFVQAGKLTSLTDVRGIMKGLGAMSDDDRVEAAGAFMKITDPKQAVLYYAELNRLNYERQKLFEDTVYQMRRQEKNADVIAMEIDRMKRELPFISEIARKNVGFTETAGKPTQPQQPGAGPSFSPENIRAERARRAKLGKQ